MRLMIREQTPLLIIYGIQSLFVPLLFWLHGQSDIWMYLYACLWSVFLLLIYLVYRYMSHSRFYQRLTTTFSSLNQSIQPSDPTPLGEALDRLLYEQYHTYQNELIQYKQSLERHIIFINQWVHQMKTPLSVMHMIVQSEDHPATKSLEEELDRLKKGLEMVLYTSRLEHFEHDFYVERLSLHQVVNQAILENKSLFIHHHVYPNVSVDQELSVYSDEKWLTFMFGQLITNAVKYTESKGSKVMISTYRRNHQIVWEVKDQGIGIPKKDLRRVFEPYFTGQHGRRYTESTGMGLYLVQKISKHLDHQIELESEVDVGTTVRILFTKENGASHG